MQKGPSGPKTGALGGLKIGRLIWQNVFCSQSRPNAARTPYSVKKGKSGTKLQMGNSGKQSKRNRKQCEMGNSNETEMGNLDYSDPGFPPCFV